MTLGQGAISSTRRKQKINTKSSTETELVAVHDKLRDVLWMRYFLESQGYSIEENIIYQDNMSTLSLEKNAASPDQTAPSISKQNITWYKTSTNP